MAKQQPFLQDPLHHDPGACLSIHGVRLHRPPLLQFLTDNERTAHQVHKPHGSLHHVPPDAYHILDPALGNTKRAHTVRAGVLHYFLRHRLDVVRVQTAVGRGFAAIPVEWLELDGSRDAFDALQRVHHLGDNRFGRFDASIGLQREVADECQRGGWFLRDGYHHEFLQVDLPVSDQPLPWLAAALPQSHGPGDFAIRVHQLGLAVVLLSRNAHALHVLHKLSGKELHVATAT